MAYTVTTATAVGVPVPVHRGRNAPADPLTLAPAGSVESMNVKRRKMLSVGQRAIAAAESWGLPGVGRRPRKGEIGGGHAKGRSSLTEDLIGPTAVGQRAIGAAESWGLPGVGRRPKKGEVGRNRSPAAGDLGPTIAEMARRWEVSTTLLEQAVALVERDPDAAAEVKSGGRGRAERRRPPCTGSAPGPGRTLRQDGPHD